MVAIAVLAAQIFRFGSDDPLRPNGGWALPAIFVSIGLVVCWPLALRASQSLDRRIVGSGPQEYSRVITACLSVFGLLAMLDLMFRLNIARGFLLVALPAGTLSLLLTWWVWRSHSISRMSTRKTACGLGFREIAVVDLVIARGGGLSGLSRSGFRIACSLRSQPAQPAGVSTSSTGG
ncbi:hypothetical protein [Gordonia sp. 852002-51296_SCH5728562-b]|uniref:hypothetical protein n=1 Tax=Gordonia sp. 852002-51296_SCH5728562-b TaxID=1834101 RepID=UPI0007EA015A|nr:hypothetical protein [Gordonia sp. 852002-51296_SCH5728562-b]OBA30879.1 hypothetical protein A5766_15175 [Gordonia sp. 852002-51296_SCH5728562-b]